MVKWALKLRRKVFLMPMAHMAELVLHAMAGMYCGRAHGLLRLHCVVAQGSASRILSVLLVMVDSLVGVLFGGGVLVLFGMLVAALVVALFLLVAFFVSVDDLVDATL